MAISAVSSDHPLRPAADEPYDEYDWALLQLENNMEPINIVEVPGGHGNHIFVGRCSESLLDNTKVWVVTRRGLLNAHATPGSATSINFPGSLVSQSVWSIQLSESLGSYIL
jgi:hypothetical protein